MGNEEIVSSRKEFIIFLLLELNKRVIPVDLGKLYQEISPSTGLDGFRSILDEMAEKGWLIKKSEPKGSVPGLPYLRTIELKYGISIDGFEYLVSLGLIEDKYKLENNKLSNNSIIVTGDKNKLSVNQSSSSENNINVTKAPKPATKIIKEILIGLFITIIGGLIIYYLTN